MRKHIAKLVALTALVAFIVLAGAVPHGWAPAGLTANTYLVPAAWAQQGGGNAAMPGQMSGNCGGQVTLSAGTLTFQAPCAGQFKDCMVSYAGVGTPGVGALSCAPTSVATVIASATATVSAIVINQASPAGTPAVNWVAGPN